MSRKLPEIPDLGLFSSVKLGRGVLGNTAPIIIAFVGMIAVAIWKVPNDQPLWVIGLVLLAFALVAGFLWRAFDYAQKNPGPAVLGGTHLVSYQQNELAASDPKIIDHSPSGSRNTPPPMSLAVAREDKDA